MGTVESMYLVRLARDRSVAGRKAFAEAFSEIFMADGTELAEHERALMFDILHRMIRDIEMALRQTVAERWASAPDMPRDLALILANDAIEVAYPMLTLSTVLLDEDLIEVVRNRSVEHQIAVAKRDNIPESVTDVLVETRNEDVICTLLRNASARITSATMEYLVEESRRVNAYQQPILQRTELDPRLARQMVYWVSAALRQYIVDNFDIDPATVDDAFETTASDIIRAAPNREDDKSEKLASVLEEEGAVDADLLVSALRDGETRLFVAMFCRMTRLKASLVMDMIQEPGGEGLAIACKAVGIDKEHFAAVFGLIRRGKGEPQVRLRREVRTATERYDQTPNEVAEEIVRQWRRDVGYLAALRELEKD